MYRRDDGEPVFEDGDRMTLEELRDYYALPFGAFLTDAQRERAAEAVDGMMARWKEAAKTTTKGEA